MHSPIRTKQSARRATLAAQGAASVLVVCGGVLAMAGLPGLEVQQQGDTTQPMPTDPDADQAVGTEPPTDDFVSTLDIETVDWNLNLVSNAPVPDAPVVDAGDEPPSVEPEEGVRYVGSIKVGGRAAAFMNVGGVTKLLRPGGTTFEGVQLVSVGDGQVVVSIDGRAEQTIERSAREGSAVSIVTGGAVQPAKDGTAVSSDGAVEGASFSSDMSREERRAQLLDRARGERSRWERQRGQGGGPPN